MKTLWKAAVATLALGCSLAAQAWPERPVRLVVPYAPGGAADALARVVAAELGTRLKQTVFIENKVGAGGTLGAQAVAQAGAEGHTFLYDATAFTVNPSLYAKLPFDYRQDFVPVGLVARVPTLLVVPASSPVRTVADLVQRAKAQPGRLAYASAGKGGAAHLSAELFQQGLGIDLIHVPYKGGAPALTDLAGGQVEFMFSAITASGPLVKAGRLRAIATAFDQRIDSLPQVPTVAESGLPGFSAFEWNGLWAPRGTPAEVVRRLEGELREVLASPTLRAKFAEMGAVPGSGDARAFGAFVTSETAKWARVIQTARLELD
ncbi:tripartite tricarboxylate transporter substrate binding protein [Ideonella sp. TBM-1]|uniref:Tripartite tricarboxylate transporter substrate binding protein n=2 Tax=Ideonella livida TaxID=2707176 RepID=A0A7C9TPB2_9BURK|nr:tripartite tricarboxylate transporter substrate binding protein [Ideonella livida]